MSIQSDHYEDAEEYLARAEENPDKFWEYARCAELHFLAAGGYNPDRITQATNNRSEAAARMNGRK